jgi:hypothetical protein
MNKEQLLNTVVELAKHGHLSKDEILEAYQKGRSLAKSPLSLKQILFSEIFYYMGAAVVVMGLTVLVWQHWNTFSTFAKIMTTLGTGLLFYILGTVVSTNKQFSSLGKSFHLIAGLILPVGLLISFVILGYNLMNSLTQTCLFGALFFIYALSSFLYRKSLFIIFAILYGVLTFFSLTDYLTINNPFVIHHFVEYRVLASGFSLMALAYYFVKHSNRLSLASWLNGIGVAAFLGAIFWILGWSPDSSTIGEIFFPTFAMFVMLMSIFMKSRAYLVFGGVFFLISIITLTGKYFATSLGWPITLVIIGFFLIFIGFCTVRIKIKYLR